MDTETEYWAGLAAFLNGEKPMQEQDFLGELQDFETRTNEERELSDKAYLASLNFDVEIDDSRNYEDKAYHREQQINGLLHALMRGIT